MNYWFTSDTHFCHKKVIEYSNRPFETVEEMDEALILMWNSVVRPNDTVWHLGDFAFAKKDKIIEIAHRLNGHKNLILGNHDRELKKYRYIEGAFESIQNYKELNINNEHIVMSHYAMRVWNKSHYGSMMLYGHSHGTSKPWGRSVDIGVDSKEISLDYRPYHLKEIQAYMSRKVKVSIDHHT